MKKLFAVLLIVIMIGSIVGCKAEDKKAKESSGNNETKEEIYIPVISKGFQHQFWQAVKAGAEKAAKEYKVKITFEGPETEAQIDKQIDMIQTALSKDPDALCLAALDSQAVIKYLEEAKEKGIPIIGFDSGIEGDIADATAATNNKVAAAAAADKMAELIGGKGEIALVVHDKTSITGRDRRDGFKERIEQEYKDIKIVDIQYGDGDQLKSTDITKSILLAHPDVKGVFGANEGSAIGVLNAVKALDMTEKVVVIGYDSGKQQQDAIREGKQAGAITQDPIGIGYKAVEAAVKAINGDKLEKEIDTGYYYYDKDNIDNEEIQAVLYE